MSSPYDENWLLDIEQAPVWREVKTPIANPFTGVMDGSHTSLFYKDGVLVGSGVAIPYKKQQKQKE